MYKLPGTIEKIRITRLVHLDSLPALLARRGLHASNYVPGDGLSYRSIHDSAVQAKRRGQRLPCGPGGSLHDYVPFYFGERPPMLLQLHTRQVEGYIGGQEPLVYLGSNLAAVMEARLRFVFSDGHGLAKITQWHDDLRALDQVDWQVVGAAYWANDPTDPDRKRRKQAEFLIHRFCPWDVVRGFVVSSEEAKARTEAILAAFHPSLRRPIRVRKDWYYST